MSICKGLIIIVLVLSLSIVVFAGQKYNPFEGTWETVPDDWETQYNSFNNDWSYQPQDAEVEYNPFSGKWEWDSGHNPDYDCE